MAKNVLRYGDAIILEGDILIKFMFFSMRQIIFIIYSNHLLIFVVIGESLLSSGRGVFLLGTESLQRAVDRLTLNVRLNEARNLFVSHAAASIITNDSSSEFFSNFIIGLLQ